MRFTREALFVGGRCDKLSELSGQLAKLEFDIRRSQDASGAFSILQRADSGIAMVGVEEADGESVDAGLVARVRSLHPLLPVIWVGGTSDTARFGAAPPNLLASNTHDLTNRALELVRDYLFPPALVSELVAAVESVFRGSFQTDLSLESRQLRTGREGLGAVGAMISFVGDKASGCISVCSDAPMLSRIHARILPGMVAGDDASRELVREAANQIVSRLRTFLLKHGVDVRCGFPVVQSDASLSLAYRPGRVATALALTGAGGKVHVELHLDRIDAKLDRQVAVDVLEPGSMSFLDD